MPPKRVEKRPRGNKAETSDSDDGLDEAVAPGFRNSCFSEGLMDIGEEFFEEHCSGAGKELWHLFLEFYRDSMIDRTKNRATRCKCPNLTAEQKEVCRCSALKAFYGAMIEAELSFGSNATYLGHVQAWSLRNNEKWTMADRGILDRLKRASDKLYAKFRDIDTVAVTPDHAAAILNTLEKKGLGRVAAALYFMLLHGARMGSVVILEWRHLAIRERTEGGLEVMLTLTGGKRQDQAKDTWHSIEWTAALLVSPPPGWTRLMAQRDMHTSEKERCERIFPELTTAKVGTYLRDLKCGVTTYGFRRHAATRFYAETGSVEKTSKRMGHQTAKTTAGFYLSNTMLPVQTAYEEKNNKEKNRHVRMDKDQKM